MKIYNKNELTKWWAKPIDWILDWVFDLFDYISPYDGCVECRDHGYHVCREYDWDADELLVKK